LPSFWTLSGHARVEGFSKFIGIEILSLTEGMKYGKFEINVSELRRSNRRAISSNILIGLIVGLFVGTVVVALVVTNLLPSTPASQLNVQGIELFAGSPSAHSFNSTCRGDAYLELSVVNPSSSPIPIVNVTITGSTLSKSATTFVDVSNGCLSITEANSSIPANTDFDFVGYVNAPLQFGLTYNCVVELGDGVNVSQPLLAQS
jgi:hypothetical protein